jgi:hypothetical protein
VRCTVRGLFEMQCAARGLVAFARCGALHGMRCVGRCTALHGMRCNAMRAGWLHSGGAMLLTMVFFGGWLSRFKLNTPSAY